MIGFTANHSTKRNERIKLKGFGHSGQCHAKLKRARNGDHHNVALINAQALKLLQASVQLNQPNVFVKASTDDANMQALAVHVRGQGIWAHGLLPICYGWEVGVRSL